MENVGTEALNTKGGMTWWDVLGEKKRKTHLPSRGKTSYRPFRSREGYVSEIFQFFLKMINIIKKSK